MIHLRSLLASLGLLAAASYATAQTTLLSFTFESDTTGQAPAGWIEYNSPYGLVVANELLLPGNTSGQVLRFQYGTGNTHLNSPSVDLTSYYGSHDFTLSFDFYQPTPSTNTALLIAFTNTLDQASGGGFSWVGTDSNTGGIGGVLFTFDPIATTDWQHFEIDITSAIGTYLTEPARNGTVNDFRVAFQNWENGAGIQEAYLDNLTLTASAVPEPSTYALLFGSGFLAYAVLRRRSLVRRSPQA